MAQKSTPSKRLLEVNRPNRDDTETPPSPPSTPQTKKRRVKAESADDFRSAIIKDERVEDGVVCLSDDDEYGSIY